MDPSAKEKLNHVAKQEMDIWNKKYGHLIIKSDLFKKNDDDADKVMKKVGKSITKPEKEEGVPKKKASKIGKKEQEKIEVATSLDKNEKKTKNSKGKPRKN